MQKCTVSFNFFAPWEKDKGFYYTWLFYIYKKKSTDLWPTEAVVAGITARITMFSEMSLYETFHFEFIQIMSSTEDNK